MNYFCWFQWNINIAQYQTDLKNKEIYFFIKKFSRGVNWILIDGLLFHCPWWVESTCLKWLCYPSFYTPSNTYLSSLGSHFLGHLIV